RQFSTIAGLDSMSSANTQGQTTITLQFNLRRNIDAAAQDVQSMVSQAEGQLPQGMPTPPSFRKVNPADQPILYMAVSSATLPLSEVTDYADTRMAQRISMVSGVAQVQVFGAQKFAVRVQFDPKALAARQIGIDEAVDAIRNANVNLPTGTLYDRSLTIRGSVSDVKYTLYLTIALVVMVIFLFLRNLSATIIPSLALPFSIVGTFAVMYVLGYTVDNLSLMALTLSVGFVVD